ncbi:magnesium transporter [Scenedesmus sp. NREL 46B-D3]|nr:magnesium transporter [Scenedesmus sp. NREL 46B-D3]
MVQQETIGLALAISSSAFIGSSFIIKKRGLRAAGAAGIRAGAGGFGYLREPIWWAGLLSMVVGELANFAAYAFAPAILVTPLGALSIIISAVLAHIFLKEQLNMFGVLGCILCITGSLAIVLHAPAEKPIESVQQVWSLAMQPGFLLYSVVAVGLILWLIFWVAPEHGQENVLVYLGICSLAGSFTVTSCKALGVALKLTFQGDSQLVYVHFYLFLLIVVTCLLTQMNYLNKALDLFNTAIVSPIYYVMFTLLTIVASVIMFQDEQTRVQMATQACGFITIVSGTFLLHTTKDLDLTRLQLDAMVRGSGQDDLAAATGGSASAGASSSRTIGSWRPGSAHPTTQAAQHQLGLKLLII